MAAMKFIAVRDSIVFSSNLSMVITYGQVPISRRM